MIPLPKQLVEIFHPPATPGVLGVKATVKVSSSPAPMTTGVPGLDETVKPAEPRIRWTLLMTRSPVPTLNTWSARYFGP